MESQLIDWATNAGPALTCFCIMLVGLLACCSPCILPVLPIYFSLLATDVETLAREQSHNDSSSQQTSKPLRRTLNHKLKLPACFAIGIACAFATVTLAGTVLASLLSSWRLTMSWVGGIIVIILGLLMLVQSTPIMQRLPQGLQNTLISERRMRVASSVTRSPFSAFLLGFSFSFAWTPCVGPALSTLALVAASQEYIAWQIAYFVCFTIGFIFPFLLVAIATTPTTALIKKHQRLIGISSMVGSIVIIIIGVLMVCGVTMRTPAALSFDTDEPAPQTAQKENAVNNQLNQSSNSTNAPKNSLIKPNTIILADKRVPISFGTLPTQGAGTQSIDTPHAKVTLLTCFATWCGPCQHELPQLQKYYVDTCQENASTDVNIYLISQPTTAQNPQASDEAQEAVEQFLTNKKITIPCLFDTTGMVYNQLKLEVFPTTYVVDSKGRVAAEITGALPIAVVKAYVDEIGAEADE